MEDYSQLVPSMLHPAPTCNPIEITTYTSNGNVPSVFVQTNQPIQYVNINTGFVSPDPNKAAYGYPQIPYASAPSNQSTQTTLLTDAEGSG